MQRKAVSMVALAILSACGTTAPEARATLPRSASPPSLKVYTRDVNLPAQYQLENSADLVVDHGRVRVTVRGVLGTERAVDPDRWTVSIVDENGLSYSPTARLDRHAQRLAIEWDQAEPRTACGTTNIHPLARRVPALDAYEGMARYEFDYPGLASAQSLTVVVHRDDNELRFSWQFGEGTTSVSNYGRSPADQECGTLIVPGLVSRVADGG